MTGTGAVRPLTPAGLARSALERALPRLGEAREAGVAVRLGVDGAVEAETGALADAVAAEALGAGVPALRVRAGDFLHRRSVRLEWGAHDVDAAFERWVDWASLRREVLDPVADRAVMTWLPRLRDAATDRSAREPVRSAVPGALLVLDGPYLLRTELVGTLDVSVHLLTSSAALARRFPTPDDPRPGAWARYLDDAAPEARADLVVRHDHPTRPALLV